MSATPVSEAGRPRPLTPGRAGPRETSLAALQRRVAEALPGVAGLGVHSGAPLEVTPESLDAPRLIAARLIEGRAFRAHPVNPAGTLTPFAAFLDGAQRSRLFCYAVRGVPVIHATTGAVIRTRKNRRLGTWQHEVRSKLYAPLRLLPADWCDALAALPIEMVDTSDTGESGSSGPHPLALRDVALHRVQRDREDAEQRLGERWCQVVREPLLVDGGIGSNERMATSDCAVGVVKSHRTLYAEAPDLDVIFGLREGQRSSAFAVTSPKRTTVASWYLRLRNSAGQDPMWGLVRIEIAYSLLQGREPIAIVADAVSRRVLAEATPLALPDARWDRMVYGVRDCEEFLRAVM